MGAERDGAVGVLGKSRVQSPGKGSSGGNQGQACSSGPLAGLWG